MTICEKRGTEVLFRSGKIRHTQATPLVGVSKFGSERCALFFHANRSSEVLRKNKE